METPPSCQPDRKYPRGYFWSSYEAQCNRIRAQHTEHKPTANSYTMASRNEHCLELDVEGAERLFAGPSRERAEQSSDGS